ncbi:DNA-directed RNA polymerases I and III subunit RPAC2-like [Clavelina lepadiformis]|uniref:DNA-directed RNA polymerases I and III subunit RPAC2 n=1 Tax=Clavelina lepadiformis TaxID=159417 RepID=A0ABP0G0K3_CLALP
MEELTKAVRKLEVEQVKDDHTDRCCTFIMHDEDHTLGNALRYVIGKNPDVEFCGYSIPHPAEKKINLRIQTRGPSASEVLRKGLKDLDEICQHVLETLETSTQNFLQNSSNDVMDH